MRDEVLQDENLWFCMTCRMCEERCQEGVSPAEIFLAVRQIAVREGYIPQIFRSVVDTILEDGWMLEDAYSDFIQDDREDLGLDTELCWDTEFVKKVKERYFSGGK
jgi:heterodisulfide reductase subunit C